jgi:hypothetical protein
LLDGTDVTVLANGVNGSLGIPDGEWPSTPKQISEMIARMERVEPFEMTAGEEAEIKSWRDQIKQFTLAKQEMRIPGLFE